MKILGIMSGTSLDGLDLALCDFSIRNGRVDFQLLAAETITYESSRKESLTNAFRISAEQYFKLHASYGEFIGKSVIEFLFRHKQTADYIASHGHTIFHQPQQGFTTQIGCGATIAAQSGIHTICDFRSLDVALQGQGAPLVPIGDRDLFGTYESCLNIGGIANISFTKNGRTSAFDICIANMALNYLAESAGHLFDNGGKMAASGKCDQVLLQQLLAIETQQQSLGREFFELQFLPLLQSSGISVIDKLATCAEYTAMQIAQVLKTHQLHSVLITGGGAYNLYLIERLKHHYNGTIDIPSDDIIQFKEAIIFAYLGYLRIIKQTNTLSSVTKASRDSIGGCLYLGSK
ncbi:MAG: anhydro-N-acetylmuramic acid kinase [Bacteroidetes bacterium]|nr:anhydro-N-acetylmuramic acid kinase [Bacteroidota bacterium]